MATLELIRLDSGLHQRLKEAKIEEAFLFLRFLGLYSERRTANSSRTKSPCIKTIL